MPPDLDRDLRWFCFLFADDACFSSPTSLANSSTCGFSSLFFVRSKQAHLFWGWACLIDFHQQRVLQEHTAQRFHARLIHSGKKATERRAMRQLGASEQGHERSRKRLQTLVIGRQWGIN